ncbi:L-lactate permease [Anoxybacillus vitaminiphilus]|uniref:L-lactate permease n=1 Tax=Paranoxybacillus vitaminiphilus TaxID=581036 RepID=A0A327YLJ4_9BACL|nr:L-lactate permease [Anoxybacillus vitaminiphilus]RAK21207.1 L-lactate permease [Anoxybacillus vitaminiphilus]
MGLIIIKFAPYKKKRTNHGFSAVSVSQEKKSAITALKIISPYLILTIFIFVSHLILPIKNFLESHMVIEIHSFSFTFSTLNSPGFWLFVTCLYTMVIFKIEKRIIWDSFKNTLKQWIPFVASTVAFVSTSEVMEKAGMTAVLANVAAMSFGSFFVVISPFIGGIGGFLTGSNTGSNAMFIKLQVKAAQQVGLPTDLIAYAQNTSSSHATMACPSRVMLGASICQLESEESNLLKRISLVVLGALVLLIFVLIGWMWG